MFYTYVLISKKNNRYYIGHTNSIEERLISHNSGQVASTKNKGPWICVYFETFGTKLEANRRELEIKRRKSKKYLDLLVNNKRE